MNQTNQEKPSPILMLAPIALVLLGYHSLFYSKLNLDLSARRVQETKLREQTQNIQREQSMMLGKLQAAKKKLAEAKQQKKAAQAVVAAAEAEKAELRSLVLGRVGSEDSLPATQLESNASADQVGSSAETLVSNLGALASMLVSNVTTPASDHEHPSEISGSGACYHMNSLCSILDAHRLRRVATSDPKTGRAGSLVESERTKLEKLLGTKMAPISRYKIQLAGSFPNLVAALHDLAERLPAVSILSVSLDPVDVQTRRHIWKLEVGIRG